MGTKGPRIFKRFLIWKKVSPISTHRKTRLIRVNTSKINKPDYIGFSIREWCIIKSKRFLYKINEKEMVSSIILNIFIYSCYTYKNCLQCVSPVRQLYLADVDIVINAKFRNDI